MSRNYRRDQPLEEFRMPCGFSAKLLPFELIDEQGPRCPACGELHTARPDGHTVLTCGKCCTEFWVERSTVVVWQTREIVRVAPPNGTFG